MREVLQRVLYYAILTIGFAAFLILCSEDTPGKVTPLAVFVTGKAGALAVIGICAGAVAYMQRRGMLSDNDEPEHIWEDKT